MKNSASNPSKIQALTSALHLQAKQLLPEITAVFIQLDYSEIVHQRISQQDIENILGQAKTTLYQGLTRARNLQFGEVMIKWQLSSNSSNINESSNQNLSDLDHEIAVLQALNTSQYPQKNITAIAPPILDYQTLPINIPQQDYQLTSLVMPYYPLGSLAQQLSNKSFQPLSDKKKQSLIIQAAHLIANLHQQGWLHNDIKPSNILLNRPILEDIFSSNNANSNVKIPSLLLTDFAVAERIDKGFDIDHEINTAGTPAYLAPERWQGQSASQRSDIYAFGIMMYETLTGKRPFNITAVSSESLKEWAVEHCQKSIPTLPVEYQQYQFIINKSLAKRIEKRYQDMENVLADLELLKNN